MKDVTYGVLNFNPSNNVAAQADFERCVESLYNNRSKDFKSEVYLIDQGGPDQQSMLTEHLARKYGFQALTLRRNVGISRGINLIANLSRGKYVSLVTSDTVFPAGLDTSLIGELEGNDKLFQICPLSNNSALEYQRSEVDPEGILLTNIAQELTIQFWPRTTFEEVGYFDERWKACYENMDFALRCFLAGGYSVISQKVACHHTHNMCVKSGARNSTYNGYIDMPNGFNQDPLQKMWNEKWPNLGRFIDLYYPIQDAERLRAVMFYEYSKNVYLPYVQEVGY